VEKRRIILMHLDEVCLKGGNRRLFEKMLIRNAGEALGSKYEKIELLGGRIAVTLPHDVTDILLRRFSTFPGIAYVAPAISVPPEIDAIKNGAIALMDASGGQTFRVTAKRADKGFPITSQELNCELGALIVDKLGKRVKLENPDVELFVDVCDKEAFLYTGKISGTGGLPVGSSGRVIASLSGGIDSPVAAFMMMKRGCKVVFAHAKGSIAGSSAPTVRGKLEGIVRVLAKVQLSSKLYIVPFENIQAQIIACVPSTHRMILYRRAMMKVMNHIARIEKARGIITGDSVGQVASQTLENLGCIYAASELPVFAPLIGMNKTETVAIARSIGTYKYSIIPSPDCCSFMISKHPETKARLRDVERMEEQIPISDLVEKAVAEADILNIDPDWLE